MPRHAARLLASLTFALTAAAPAARAQGTTTVTGPSNSTNCIPFGCKFSGQSSTRYQQVYAASAFGSGPFSFNTLSFFVDPRDQHSLNTGSFNLYLSTTSAAVDALNTTNYDANRGSNTVLFGSFTIGGAAPTVLSFTGATYNYNTAAGNLLLDLVVNGALIASNDVTYFTARNDAPGGNYSRAHNFGTGNAGFGLDTQFSTTGVVPEPSTWTLLGGGLVGLAGVAARRRRQTTA